MRHSQAIARNGSNATQATEDMVVQCFGGEDYFQQAGENPSVDWHGWFVTLELRLRIQCGFDASAESSVAIDKYNAVHLEPGHDYAAVDTFRLGCETARTDMIRVCHIRVGDRHNTQRELLDAPKTLDGTALLGHLVRSELRGGFSPPWATSREKATGPRFSAALDSIS